MSYKSNRREVVQRMRNANRNMMEAVGKSAEGIAKLNAAVDTGAFRDSLSYVVDDQGANAQLAVGSDLTNEDYPVFLEKGTSKMEAQPAIGTIMNNLGTLRSVVERNYKL